MRHDISSSKAQEAAERLKERAKQEAQRGATASPRAPATRGHKTQLTGAEGSEEPEFTLKAAHDQLMSAISSC